MKAALIPPKGYYGTCHQSDYHLMLAQEIGLDYAQAYISDMDPDDYIIMDNGAAEGQMVRDSVLMTRSAYVGVDEVVMPDVIGNAEGTIERAKKFWKTVDLMDDADAITMSKFKYMGVVQSQGSLGEMIQCIEAFDEMDLVRVLGIPRHFVDKEKYGRVNLCAWLRGKGYNERFEVHLLGTNPKWPTEVGFIAHEHPWVRGVDSSLPYNYAIAGVRLNGKFVRDGGIKRPDAYFDVTRNIDKRLLQDNIDTFMRWASGTEGSQG